jgi:hypothetical protein
VENYFNYFTEIEECFRRQRGTPTLLSTLDWALIESWKEAGIPLEAVRLGIERAFEKSARRPQRFRKINGLAYCSPAVLEVAEEMSEARQEGGARGASRLNDTTPFNSDMIRRYLERNAQAVERAAERAGENRAPTLVDDLNGAVLTLRELITRDFVKAGTRFEDLERLLSALEDKITASLTRAASVELLADLRREVERGLARSRAAMSPAQFESLERQFLKRRLFEHHKIPRLSLFYLEI